MSGASKLDLTSMHRSELEAALVSMAKDVERLRNRLGHVVMNFEDEGDRVYLGSTNDADDLRDLESSMLDSLNELEMPWMNGDDLYATIRGLRQDNAALTERLERFALPEWPDADLIDILGKPNFMCIQIADLFRRTGVEIARKAEVEQAHVILFLLRHWFQHRERWAETAGADLQALHAVSPTSEGDRP